MAQDAEKLAAQGERLRELKDFAAVTYREISDAVGVTERQVQRWFSGESEVNGTNIKALAAFLGSTPDYIEYGVLKRERPDSQPQASQLDRIEARLNELIERLVAAEVLAAVEADKAQAPQPEHAKRPPQAA
jgi:transcriptional regulator with XRE-family HTH domain